MPLHLVLGSTTGHPTSGSFQVGDIDLYKAELLSVFVAAGTPRGQWHQVATTALQ